MSPTEIHDEMEQARATMHQLVSDASAAQLRRPSNGTRWTNRQLLFHMVFGYLIVRTLLPLVHLLGRVGWSRRFAAILDATRRPFHLVNYLGSAVGGQVLTVRSTGRLMDRTITALQHRLTAETDESGGLAMHFPTTWDPYFKPSMTVLDIYHFGTQHFDHHKRQLTLEG